MSQEKNAKGTVDMETYPYQYGAIGIREVVILVVLWYLVQDRVNDLARDNEYRC